MNDLDFYFAIDEYNAMMASAGWINPGLLPPMQPGTFAAPATTTLEDPKPEHVPDYIAIYDNWPRSIQLEIYRYENARGTRISTIDSDIRRAVTAEKKAKQSA